MVDQILESCNNSLICPECAILCQSELDYTNHYSICALTVLLNTAESMCNTEDDLIEDGSCPISYEEVETRVLLSEEGHFSGSVSLQVPVEWIQNGDYTPYKSTYEILTKNQPEPDFTDCYGSESTIDGPQLKPFTKMTCPICHIELYRHNYVTHFRVHSGERPYQCYFCERSFRTTSSRKVHHRTHTGEKPYQCAKCSYATITKRNLDRHMENQHSTLQYYEE